MISFLSHLPLAEARHRYYPMSFLLAPGESTLRQVFQVYLCFVNGRQARHHIPQTSCCLPRDKREQAKGSAVIVASSESTA